MMALDRSNFSRVYTRREDVAADLARAYADEISGLDALGRKYLQIDDVLFSLLCNERMRKAFAPAGTDPSRTHIDSIKLFNESVRNRPPGMTICTHTCRGNFRSGWITSGGYDFIAEPYFGELAVDGFFLEFDDERSGSFAPLRFIPKGKMVVLGIVSSKRAQLESKDELKRRIDEAAKYVPLKPLCLSPQCGFASTQEGNALTPQEQEAKLRLVVETAREVWG
jgi:5-methyltetrahydropteroyltriglutamate--homocysteine methyltransferase